MSESQASVPFLATSNGLISLLVIAMIAPVLLPVAGIAASLMLPLMVIAIVWMRPELGRRWYVLAALPMLLWGLVAISYLFFR